MGMWVVTKLAFGVDLGSKIPKNLYLTDDPDAEHERWDSDILNFFEAWKKSKDEDLDFPFDILTYCSYDYGDARYFLAYTPTVQTGYSDKPLLVNFPEVDSALIKKLIEEHGFGQDVTPAWSIVSLYG